MARQAGSVVGVAVLVAILDAGGHAAHTLTAFQRAWWFTAATAFIAAIACSTIGFTGRRSMPKAESTRTARLSATPPTDS